jgi:transporter family-2 protein
MNTRSILAIAAALGTGVAIAFQATLNGRVGAIIGPFRAGLLINALGGSLAILAMAAWWCLAAGMGTPAPGFAGVVSAPVPTARLFGWMAAAGLLGILVVVGVAFAVGTVGVTAGLAAVILAQLLVGLLLDRSGATTGTPVAIDARRIIGVVAMALGVWLLLPQGR